MSKLTKRSKDYVPAPTIFSHEETYEHPKGLLTPGVEIRIYGIQGTFKFRRFTTNTQTGESWIDCLSVKRGSFHSFYPERVSTVVRQRKRRSKVVKLVGK